MMHFSAAKLCRDQRCGSATSSSILQRENRRQTQTYMQFYSKQAAINSSNMAESLLSQHSMLLPQAITASMPSSDSCWSQAVGSLIRMGSELLLRGQHDEAIAILDAAHSVITSPMSSATWVSAAKSLQMGTQLLQTNISLSKDALVETLAPDLYQEDECDVGPRMLKTPISSADVDATNSQALLEAIVLFNKALIYHAKGNTAEAKQVYEVVTFTVQQATFTTCTPLSSPYFKVFAELAMRSYNNLGLIHYRERHEGVAAASFEFSAQFARHLAPLTSSYRLEYATALSNWCRVNWMCGDISDKLYAGLKEVLDIRSTTLKWDHPDVAAARYNMAVAEYARQDTQKAVAQLTQYLEVASHRSKEQSLDDLDAVPALIFLLLIQNEEKDDHASQELVRGLRTLQEKRQDLGPNSSEVASVLNFVGTLLFHKQEFASALVFFQEELRLEDYNESLFVDFPGRSVDKTTTVSVTCNNIGRILQELGRYDEAITFYRRALESENYEAGDVKLTSGKKGANVPASMAARASAYKTSSANLYSTVWYNLGLIHDKLGAYNEAIAAFEMSLELRKVLLGNDHPDIACLLYNIGVLQMEQQRLDGASTSFREALRIRRVGTAGQLSDLHVVKTLEKLASLHKAKGNIEGALEAAREVLAIQEASMEYDAVARFKELGVTLRSIAELYHASGELDAAVPMAVDSVTKLRIAADCAAEKMKANVNRALDHAFVLDHVSSTEQLVASLLLLGSLHHERCEPLQAEPVLRGAALLVQEVATSTVVHYPALATPSSLHALREVTRMLGGLHCAPQA